MSKGIDSLADSLADEWTNAIAFPTPTNAIAHPPSASLLTLLQPPLETGMN